ncbi:MAG: hypothetical protein J0H83_19420 [Candidatus Melainabacteria bacterium]|nr:hypothetical protein [Candidatus Melainabacteria bacterium]
MDSKFGTGSWHKRDGYKNQFERTYRWLVRLQDLESGQFVQVRPDHSLQRDYLLAFFNACFSIRDWVKGEAGWHKIAARVDSDVQLLLCRDIANGSKHMTLTHPSVDADFGFATRVGPEGHKIAFAVSSEKLVKATEIAYEKIANTYGGSIDVASLHAELKSNGIHNVPGLPIFMDAMKLAADCLAAWELYLEKADLLTKEDIAKLKENAFNHKGF